MLPDTDDAAIQADAYIDSLLAGHGRLPVALPVADGVRPAGVRDAIRILERGLPRFHPSFLFEEWLAEQLRKAAGGDSASDERKGQVIPYALIRTREIYGDRRLGPDRRLIVGGAIASGFSLAGAAVIAWRRRRD